MALAREIFKFSKLSDLSNFTKISNTGRIQTPLFIKSVRTAKHWNPKWKWERKQKVIPIDLPDFQDTKSQRSKEKMRSKMKELGIMPPRYWRERPMTVTSLCEILDPYVPPEGDGKASLLTKDGAKALASSINKKRESMLAVRKIKGYESHFDLKVFPQIAHDIYVKAHTVLMNKDEEELSEFVTESAIVQMMNGIKNNTLRWKFIKSLEPPIAVHARAHHIITSTNLFAQVTVRFHTKQTLAIYDRFGRLMYGSETVPKDVLEYVVFEKHIVNEYGTWRLHGKIIPEWMPLGEPSAKTYRVKEEETEELDDEDFVEEDYDEEQKADVEIVKKESEVKA